MSTFSENVLSEYYTTPADVKKGHDFHTQETNYTWSQGQIQDSGKGEGVCETGNYQNAVHLYACDFFFTKKTPHLRPTN